MLTVALTSESKDVQCETWSRFRGPGFVANDRPACACAANEAGKSARFMPIEPMLQYSEATAYNEQESTQP